MVEGPKHSTRLLHQGNVSNPMWFPSGKKLLFTKNKDQLYSIDVDGTNLSYITDFGLTTSHTNQNLISISPSGNLIAFTSAYDKNALMRKTEPSIPEVKNETMAPLFVIAPNGTGLQRVTPAKIGDHYYIRDWSPDGTMLAAVCINYNTREHMNSVIYPLDGTDLSKGWKKMHASQVIGKEPKSFTSVDTKENAAQTKPDAANEKNNQTPSFRAVYTLMALVCVYLTKVKR